MYLQYSCLPYLSPFAKCLEGNLHHQHVHFFMFPIDWPVALITYLSCCTGFLVVVLLLWRRDRNCMDSYQVSMVDVPESLIASNARGPWQQRCDSLHCHENSWVLYHQVSSFPPESMRLRSLCRSERTTARDPVQHKIWIYPCYRAVNTEHYKNGRTGGARRLPNIWQKVINKGGDYIEGT